MRVEVLALDEVHGQRLDPLRRDARNVARVETRCLDELRRHDPLRCRFAQNRTREDQEFDSPCAEIFVSVVALQADIAEQTREQRAMDLVRGRGCFIELHAELGHQRSELAVDIAPFAQRRCDRKCSCSSSIDLRFDFLCLSAS